MATVLDNLETDSGWTVNLEGTDNATTGALGPGRSDRTTEYAQPEDDHTPAPGVDLLGDRQRAPRGAAGEQDVDGGTTTLYSPVYDLTGSGQCAKVKYYRWYSERPGRQRRRRHLDRAGPQQRRRLAERREHHAVFRFAGSQISFDLYALFGADLGTVQFKFIASDLNQPRWSRRWSTTSRSWPQPRPPHPSIRWPRFSSRYAGAGRTRP